jgi:hypothetical protein
VKLSSSAIFTSMDRCPGLAVVAELEDTRVNPVPRQATFAPSRPPARSPLPERRGRCPHSPHRAQAQVHPVRGLAPGTPRARTERRSFSHGDPSEGPSPRASQLAGCRPVDVACHGPMPSSGSASHWSPISASPGRNRLRRTDSPPARAAGSSGNCARRQVRQPVRQNPCARPRTTTRSDEPLFSRPL